jgi:hypothetical protein
MRPKLDGWSRLSRQKEGSCRCSESPITFLLPSGAVSVFKWPILKTLSPRFFKSSVKNQQNNRLTITLRGGRHETPVQTLPNPPPRDCSDQRKKHLARMDRDPRCHVNQILHHRPNPAPFRLLPVERPFFKIAVILPETPLTAKP